MVTIRELKKVCYRGREERGLIKFLRVQSYYIAKLLLYTNISGNQTSILFIIIGVIGCVMLILMNVWSRLIGMLLLYLWTIGDCADGVIARYRIYEKTKT